MGTDLHDAAAVSHRVSAELGGGSVTEGLPVLHFRHPQDEAGQIAPGGHFLYTGKRLGQIDAD